MRAFWGTDQTWWASSARETFVFVLICGLVMALAIATHWSGQRFNRFAVRFKLLGAAKIHSQELRLGVRLRTFSFSEHSEAISKLFRARLIERGRFSMRSLSWPSHAGSLDSSVVFFSSCWWNHAPQKGPKQKHCLSVRLAWIADGGPQSRFF